MCFNIKNGRTREREKLGRKNIKMVRKEKGKVRGCDDDMTNDMAWHEHEGVPFDDGWREMQIYTK